MTSRRQTFCPDDLIAAVAPFMVGCHCPRIAGIFESEISRVYQVSYTDHPSVCLRVACGRLDEEDDAVIARTALDAGIYEKLESSGFGWSSRLVGSSLTFDNPINYPFIVVEFAGGNNLQWTDVEPSQPARNDVLEQLAEIHLQLLQCTLETRNTTAYEYYEGQLTQDRDQQTGFDRTVDEELLEILPGVLGDYKDSRLFAMDHGNLHPSNIIVSDNYRIVGIIDWGMAEMVPIAEAARLPPAIFARPSTGEASSGIARRDRETYVRAYGGNNCRSSRAMRYVQTGDRAAHHALFFDVVKRKGSMKPMSGNALTDVLPLDFHDEY